MDSISFYLPIILASGVLAFVGTPLTRWLAHRVGMVDQPGLRKAHRSPIPLLGGLAMYASLMLAFLLLGNGNWIREGAGILGGATILFLAGLWDDRYGLPARAKFLPQVAAALVLVASGIQTQIFGNPWLDVPLTVFWVVGITNAVNMMDNMDGLAAGIAAVAAAFFFLLAALQGQGLVASLAAALLGATLGFLFYNFSPAMTFMGDAGALTLGFLLAALGIKLNFVNLPLASTWMAPILVLGVLIFDTTLVTISRLRRGRSPFQGGSDHTSHRLTFLGLSAPRAVLTLYLGALSLGVLAVVVTRLEPLAANGLFAGVVLAGVIALVLFERVEPKLTGDPPLVLMPGRGGLADMLTAVSGISRNLTVLVGRASPLTREEVIEGVAHLAEDKPAARFTLERALGEDWLADLPRVLPALRLHGDVWVVETADDPDVKRALRRAKLVVAGLGDTSHNAGPLAHLLAESLAPLALNVLWAGEGAPDWALPANRLSATQPAAVQLAAQNRLIKQAAAQAKTQVSGR